MTRSSTAAIAAMAFFALAVGLTPVWAEEPTPAPRSTTVGGVTIDARKGPPKKCSDRDTPCIQATAKQLWDQYPDQTKTFCQQQEMRILGKRWNLEAMHGADLVPIGDTMESQLPPAIRIVCTWPQAEAKAAAAATVKAAQ